MERGSVQRDEDEVQLRHSQASEHVTKVHSGLSLLVYEMGTSAPPAQGVLGKNQVTCAEHLLSGLT